MKAERKEVFMRILVAIVSGIILGIWKGLIQILTLFHWFYVLFTAKRSKGLANFCEIWNTQVYKFIRYLSFVTNERPFPFSKLGENITKFDSAKIKKS
ncbi:MAG TPA: DUF4389 domain-containing protein [Candidatus Nanoarchaeia archaeon]|nr:DUF4389 domain-containing protein [Candidatus Nanoarchaeia archaeon]